MPPCAARVLLPVRRLGEAFVGRLGGRAGRFDALEVVFHASVWLARRGGWFLLLDGERAPPVARLATRRGERLLFHATFDLDNVATRRGGRGGDGEAGPQLINDRRSAIYS